VGWEVGLPVWLAAVTAGLFVNSSQKTKASRRAFNTVNQSRVLGRLVRMITIPSQSSVASAYEQFDGSGERKEQAEKGRSSNRHLQAM
jgi:hypothetical protein